MNNNEKVVVKVEADTTAIDASLEQLKKNTEAFGSAFASSISGAILQGKSFQETLRSIGASLAQVALKSALKPLEGIAGNLFASLFSGASSSAIAIPNAKGGAFGPAGPVPFAKGGVVAAPSYFDFQGGTGLMGEAGAEAILPLARGPDGSLGVASGQSQRSSPNIIFNVNAPDATSFQRSESQITSMLARAVNRGGRNL